MYRTFLADVLFTERHRLALISGCFAFHDLWSCGLCPTSPKLQHIPPYSNFNQALVAAINPRHQSLSRSSNPQTHASAPDAVNSIHVSSPSFINTYFRVQKRENKQATARAGDTKDFDTSNFEFYRSCFLSRFPYPKPRHDQRREAALYAAFWLN